MVKVVSTLLAKGRVRACPKKSEERLRRSCARAR
jgi:hypothetical protein